MPVKPSNTQKKPTPRPVPSPSPAPKKTNTTTPVVKPSNTPSAPTKSNEELEVESFTRQFYFDGKTMSQLYNENDLERLVKFTIRDSKDLGISLPEAYVMFVYKLFNNNIQKISVPTKYSDVVSKMDLMEQLIGLGNLLSEQSKKTHTTFVVKNGKLVPPPTTVDQSNVTLDTVVSSQGYVNLDGSVDGSLPEESPAVAEIKKKLGYTVETGNVMTDDFVKFLKNWQGQNQITPTGAIDYKTVIKLYPEKTPKLTPSETTTTTPPTPPTSGEKSTKLTSIENTQFSDNRNVKSILTYSDRVDLTGEPDWDTCKMLIDTYSKVIPVIIQSIKVGNLTAVDKSDATLSKIKKSVEWCIAKHRNKFRLKISDMNKINNLTEPFNINKNILK